MCLCGVFCVPTSDKKQKDEKKQPQHNSSNVDNGAERQQMSGEEKGSYREPF